MFNFAGALSGTLMTSALGILAAKYNAPHAEIADPLERQLADGRVDGRVLALGVAISYLGCAPLFILSGQEYARDINKMKVAMTNQKIDQKFESED